jgi:hypothetical protein
MAKKRKPDDPLATLVATAPPRVLADLLIRLAATRPDVRRECFDYLEKHVQLSDKQRKLSKGEALLAIWSELIPELSELDDYGGGDYDQADHVASLLYEIQQKLIRENIDAVYRHELLDYVLPYIESGNAGLDDELYAVAYAACYDHKDLRLLAEALEAMQGEWQLGHARGIYRKIGDRDKYLELRNRRMVYGGDYFDLASFYWKVGEKEKAMQVAEEGLRKGQGRMDELRQFVAQRAKDAGNRDRYLRLQFEQTIDHPTCDKYKAFRKLCTTAEWKAYEKKILARIKDAWESEQLKIRMHRKEYDKAVAVLNRGRYPLTAWDSDYLLQTAKRLESRFPEEILKYYLTGLGNLKASAGRKEYTRKAQVMAKIRRLLVEVLHDNERWHAFAIKVKQNNIKRPAFQEEFSKAVQGWRELKQERRRSPV